MLSHSFFPLFDKYIYNLVTTIEDIRLSTLSVLRDFANDGVVYLELRTTPRSIPDAGVTKETYVSSVLDTIDAFNAQQDKIKTYLILSIDRRNNTDQADEVVDLALRYTDKGVLGVDLCGNPLCGDVSIFQPAFARAKAGGLNIALHFGEVPTSGTKEELQTLLSYGPQRLGHVICVPEEIKSEVLRKRLALELCLSCNVLAKLSMGGFADHHFGEWRKTNCPIALSTDDVGIFESSLSNEYFLAAQHFDLTYSELVVLSYSAVNAIFGGEQEKRRLRRLLITFGNTIPG
ncbi:hypothetical protein H2203_001974 [Taxawa tesnikishii (nom. ined.)]|nr:hypothetical protein H2203_001974 [Dothideales sp. JES 119]